jgi:hypothetical protein
MAAPRSPRLRYRYFVVSLPVVIVDVTMVSEDLVIIKADGKAYGDKHEKLVSLLSE